MADVETISVTVTPEIAKLMRGVVESGEYASAGEVVRDALMEWTLRRSERVETAEDLRRLWDEGMASGPPVDGRSALARIRRTIAERSAGTGTG